jgi:hypothetical protein
MDKIKITFEAYGIKHSVELNNDVDTLELCRVISNLIESMTFQPESIVKGYLNEIKRLEREL